MYLDGHGSSETVVYKGAMPDGKRHTAQRQDGSKLVTADSHLRLLDQPDFSNIPSTPLDYRKEVGTGISVEEAQALA